MMKMANNLLSIKDRQKYLKKIGLYKGKIDKIEGKGTKNAYRYLNVIFLNKNSDKYTNESDSKLRIIYKSYCKSKYMKTDDWKLFKDFKENEFKCTCKGKYCDGYNGRKNKCYIKLIMLLQYIRNYYDKSVYISSGVRCKKRNQQVGGVKNSKHLVFKASDIKVENLKASQVYKVIKNMPLVDYTYIITTYYIHVNV